MINLIFGLVHGSLGMRHPQHKYVKVLILRFALILTQVNMYLFGDNPKKVMGIILMKMRFSITRVSCLEAFIFEF